jgi:hypothetical protein
MSISYIYFLRNQQVGKIQKLFKSSIKRKFPGFFTYSMTF